MREGGFNASLLDTVCAQGLPTTLHLAVVSAFPCYPLSYLTANPYAGHTHTQGWEELGSKALSLARKSLLKNIHSRYTPCIHIMCVLVLVQVSWRKATSVQSTSKQLFVYLLCAHPHTHRSAHTLTDPPTTSAHTV